VEGGGFRARWYTAAPDPVSRSRARADTPGSEDRASGNPGRGACPINGEYDRFVSESSPAGIGGWHFTNDDMDYVNADTFFRFYPQGNPLDGWAFGGKLGLTSIDDFGTYFGFGFDVNRSRLPGRNNNFHVGAGLGLKRLLGVSDEDDPSDDVLRFIPTIRLVNIVFAFQLEAGGPARRVSPAGGMQSSIHCTMRSTSPMPSTLPRLDT
jgi:hypothetical protein